jgi:hypothetical protein
MIFEISYWTQNVCFDFLYIFVWNIEMKWERYDKNVYRSSRKVHFILVRF